jgi:hypothetical protein
VHATVAPLDFGEQLTKEGGDTRAIHGQRQPFLFGGRNFANADRDCASIWASVIS